jgi:hypothetical protein
LQSSNSQAQDQSWQNRPNTQITGFQSPQSVGFNTQNTQNFVPQSSSWQSKISFWKIHIFSFHYLDSQIIPNQQPFIETTTVRQNLFSLQGLFISSLILL